MSENFESSLGEMQTYVDGIPFIKMTDALQLARSADKLSKENAALKAAIAEVEKQTGHTREILRTVGNNLAVLHHD